MYCWVGMKIVIWILILNYARLQIYIYIYQPRKDDGKEKPNIKPFLSEIAHSHNLDRFSSNLLLLLN